MAVELAEKNNLIQIDSLINKFANILIEKNKKMDLVELYRKAHKHPEATKMLINIAKDFKALNVLIFLYLLGKSIGAEADLCNRGIGNGIFQDQVDGCSDNPDDPANSKNPDS
jgi:hypothetical protein